MAGMCFAVGSPTNIWPQAEHPERASRHTTVWSGTIASVKAVTVCEAL